MLGLAVVSLGLFQGAHAWGALGHQTVAYVAQHYVKDSTASWAKSILSDTSDSYLANVATWADTFRTTAAGKYSAPFHFIDAEDDPPRTCNVDYNRDCGSSGCSVSAIANYTQRLGDGRLSSANRAEAMKFIVHLLGDVTQPLHDEAISTGGNDIKVTFQGYTNDNLHSIWDTYMPQALVGGSTMSDAKNWAGNITADIDSGMYKSQAGSWISGDSISSSVTTATKWATDANKYVCSTVMPNGVAPLQQGDLYPQYYNGVIDTIELQIAKGGYRLANWLNLIAAANSKKKREEFLTGRDAGMMEETQTESAAVVERELNGAEFLPPARQLSRAKLARMAIGYGCGHEH